MNRFKVTGLSLVFLGLIAALISGCAVGPYVAPVAPPTPTITINTVPSGADISIQGNYMGKSPLVVQHSGTGTEPMRIEARLEGYEPKEVLFGYYHPPVAEVLTRPSNIFLADPIPVGTKTIPAYYTFYNSIDIKLYPKAGVTSVPSTPPSDVQKSVSEPRIPAGVYQATRNYRNGDKYIGEFLNGQFHGKGIYTYANGDKYEGEFINGKFTGKGTFTCSNGEPFTGIIENKVPLEYTIRCN